jgi:predicted nucleic acid-binding protein
MRLMLDVHLSLWPNNLRVRVGPLVVHGCAKSCMTGRTFVDTNVLVYAFDDADSEKRDAARAILGGSAPLVISAQVVGEFYVVVTRKLAITLSPELAKEAVEQMLRFHVVAIDGQLTRDALATSQAEQLSYWDALIVEAAIMSGCDRLLTEDFAHGQSIRSLHIENPFA